MKKLVAQSSSEDLRKPSWKMKCFSKQGDNLIQVYSAEEGKTVQAITKFTGYEDAFGNPVIAYQEIYELEEQHGRKASNEYISKAAEM
jgi:hypothetical protein